MLAITERTLRTPAGLPGTMEALSSPCDVLDDTAGQTAGPSSRLSRRSHSSSLKVITYAVSRGDHVRRVSRRLRTSSLVSNSHLKRG